MGKWPQLADTQVTDEVAARCLPDLLPGLAVAAVSIVAGSAAGPSGGSSWQQEFAIFASDGSDSIIEIYGRLRRIGCRQDAADAIATIGETVTPAFLVGMS